VASAEGAYAQFLMSRHRYGDALPYARQAASDAPQILNSQTTLALVAQEVGNDEEAVRAWRRALAIQPRNPPVAGALASLLVELSQYAEAADLARAAIADDALNTGYERTLAQALAGIGDDAGARAAWERILEIDPGNQEAQTQVAGTRPS
jgi:Tfp pilus assembly protein PilF